MVRMIVSPRCKMHATIIMRLSLNMCSGSFGFGNLSETCFLDHAHADTYQGRGVSKEYTVHNWHCEKFTDLEISDGAARGFTSRQGHHLDVGHVGLDAVAVAGWMGLRENADDASLELPDAVREDVGAAVGSAASCTRRSSAST
jgi:hypothetical protein